MCLWWSVVIANQYELILIHYLRISHTMWSSLCSKAMELYISWFSKLRDSLPIVKLRRIFFIGDIQYILQQWLEYILTATITRVWNIKCYHGTYCVDLLSFEGRSKTKRLTDIATTGMSLYLHIVLTMYFSMWTTMIATALLEAWTGWGYCQLLILGMSFTSSSDEREWTWVV